MRDYFSMDLSKNDILKISVLGLAHIGDAVFELMVRSYLCENGGCTSRGLHNATVAFVSAPSQARAAERLLPFLSEEEADIYRRGRNAKVNSVPSNASLKEYHSATGLEALFGYVYLKGDKTRLNELFAVILEDGYAS